MMGWSPAYCKICHLPQGWRDVFVYNICPFCWRGELAEKIIKLIPEEEKEGWGWGYRWGLE